MALKLLLIFQLCIWAIFSLIAPQAYAQTENDSDDIIDLGVIYVEESYFESDEIIDSPTSFAIVLDPQELSRQSITLSDALDSLPGVSIRSFGGLGSLSTISIRGAGSENVLVLLDGVPLNPTGGSVDISDIPLDSLERIEIIRGGEGAIYGGGAVGGIIKLTSKSIFDDANFSARLTAGSFDTLTTGLTWRENNNVLHFDFAGSSGNFSFHNDNGTVFDQSDDFPDTRENNEFASFDFRFGHLWELPDSRLVNFSVEWFRDRKGIPGITTLPSPHASQSNTRTYMQGTYSDADFHNGNLSLVVSWLRQSRNFVDEFGESTGVPIYSSQNHNRYESRAEWSGPGFTTSDILTTGATIFRETLDTELNNPSRNTFALWLRDELYMHSGGVISGAVRYDNVGGDSILSPEIGIKYPISSTWTVQSNFGLDFRSPSFEELYRNEGFVIGNPDLSNERTLSFDLGLVHTVNDLRLEAVYFNNQTKDLIDYLLISGFRWKPFNIGRMRSSGLEFSMDWLIANDLELRGNYTRTRAIDTSGDSSRSGMPIVGQPSSDIFTELRWKPDPWEVFINWERQGSSPVTSSGSKFLPPTESAGFGLGYNFDNGVSMMFEMKNLFDSDIYDVRGFPLPGRSYFLTINGEY
ncbi:MAG: TonB-dependent receptor [bacterium]|nr:TonB-dependent receptor [bacterium]